MHAYVEPGVAARDTQKAGKVSCGHVPAGAHHLEVKQHAARLAGCAT